MELGTDYRIFLKKGDNEEDLTISSKLIKSNNYYQFFPNETNTEILIKFYCSIKSGR